MLCSLCQGIAVNARDAAAAGSAAQHLLLVRLEPDDLSLTALRARPGEAEDISSSDDDQAWYAGHSSG